MYLRDGSPRDINVPRAGSPGDINVLRAGSPRDKNIPGAGSPRDINSCHKKITMSQNPFLSHLEHF